MISLIFAVVTCIGLPISQGDDGVLFGPECAIEEIVAPPLPTPPPPSTNDRPTHLAVGGCSNTRLNSGDDPGTPGIEDYLGENLLVKTRGLGNCSVKEWVRDGGQNRCMDSYRANVEGQTVDGILAQICVTNTEIPYSDVVTYLNLLRSEVTPGVPLYVWPIGSSGATSGCSYGDYDQSVAHYWQAIAEGDALPGPILYQPYTNTELTNSSGSCHPNSAGTRRMFDEAVLPWLESF